VELCGLMGTPSGAIITLSVAADTSMTPPKRVHVPPPSPEDSQKQFKRIIEITRNYKGGFDELENALGMYMIGPLIGWKVLLLIHNKRTIKKYEEILGIKVREEFPAEGPLAYKSVGLKFVKDLGNFWKAVSGEQKIDDRRELTTD
jgi:hypothetical protein